MAKYKHLPKWVEQQRYELTLVGWPTKNNRNVSHWRQNPKRTVSSQKNTSTGRVRVPARSTRPVLSLHAYAWTRKLARNLRVLTRLILTRRVTYAFLTRYAFPYARRTLVAGWRAGSWGKWRAPIPDYRERPREWEAPFRWCNRRSTLSRF
jgi:hypothetical protein